MRSSNRIIAAAIGAAVVTLSATANIGAVPPVEPLPPAHPDGVAPVWPYADFADVPQLGAEPVMGSGCSGIRDVIPDGLWAGFVTAVDVATDLSATSVPSNSEPSTGTPSGGTLSIDLVCAFNGDMAASADLTTANVIATEPIVIVNDSEYRRTMPSALAAVIDGTTTADGGCVEGTHSPPEVIAASTDRLAWIRIDGGAVTWVFFSCWRIDEPSPTTTTTSPPTTTPTTPATEPPAPAGTTERIEFAPGTSGGAVSGGVVVGTTNRYLLGAAAGQTMDVAITSVEGNARFAIYAPDGSSLATESESATVTLPADGDYVIEVGSTRGNASYDLSVSIE